jgi:sulfonate transport system permease protein
MPRPGRAVVGWIPAVLVVVAFVVVWWWYAGVAPGDGLLLPTPGRVLSSLGADWNIIAPALLVTIRSASQGFLIGAVIAISFAVLASSLPWARHPVTRTLTIAFCLPLAAIAPLLFLLVPLPGPHVIMAAISVVFPIYVSVVQGLATRHDAWEDLRTVLGGSRAGYLLRVQLPASTREFLTAARIAVPTAILGTTLAEYFGGATGIGVLMINSLSMVNAPRAYALGVVITLLSVAGYALVGLVERLLPWTKEIAQ